MILEFREELAAQGQTSKKYARPARGSPQRNVGLHARPCAQALGRRALSNLHVTNPNPDLPPALCSGISQITTNTLTLAIRRPIKRSTTSSILEELEERNKQVAKQKQQTRYDQERLLYSKLIYIQLYREGARYKNYYQGQPFQWYYISPSKEIYFPLSNQDLVDQTKAIAYRTIELLNPPTKLYTKQRQQVVNDALNKQPTNLEGRLQQNLSRQILKNVWYTLILNITINNNSNNSSEGILILPIMLQIGMLHYLYYILYPSPQSQFIQQGNLQ